MGNVPYPNLAQFYRITETGFPSGGSDCSSSQETSVERTQAYFDSVKNWTSFKGIENVFYFAYFDKETEENQGRKSVEFKGGGYREPSLS